MLAACDLDRTLIYTRRSAALPAGTPEPPLRWVEEYAGKPLSFLTVVAARRLRQLARDAVVVPVTTRTLAQLRRVRLPAASTWAIAANGGHLLRDGVPDPGWARRVAGALREVAGPQEVARRVHADPALDWLAAGLRTADDLFLYAVVDRALATSDRLGDLDGWLAAVGWTLSVQGRKVYLVPAPLTKLAAVRELQERLGDQTLAAIGDALLDRELLAAADVAARPPHGELAAAGWTCSGLVVTPRPGVLAAEDLLGHLLLATARHVI